jgi:hypothetical protein
MAVAVSTLLLAFLFLVSCVSGYRLEGNWTLRTSEISELKSLITPITFSFIETATNSTSIHR